MFHDISNANGPCLFEKLYCFKVYFYTVVFFINNYLKKINKEANRT